jgi:hypothetical protein
VRSEAKLALPILPKLDPQQGHHPVCRHSAQQADFRAAALRRCVDMANETLKVLLLILLFGGLEAAIRMPKTRRSFLDRATAWVGSKLALPHNALQLRAVRRRTRKRGYPR